jgi:hypothetical protein
MMSITIQMQCTRFVMSAIIRIEWIYNMKQNIIEIGSVVIAVGIIVAVAWLTLVAFIPN